MAATNRATLLDAAIMRAGRFDRRITIDFPDYPARLEILHVHARKHPLADDVDLPQLAKDVPGLVGADLANLLNEGALGAVREGTDLVYQRHLTVRLSPFLSPFNVFLSFFDLRAAVLGARVPGAEAALRLCKERGRAPPCQLCAVSVVFFHVNVAAHLCCAAVCCVGHVCGAPAAAAAAPPRPAACTRAR